MEYEVEFFTSTEASNPWRAAMHAWNEIELSKILLVRNVITNKSYEIRLGSGEILCPLCSSDITSPDENCVNCARQG
jgi:hypothetical protein